MQSTSFLHTTTTVLGKSAVGSHNFLQNEALIKKSASDFTQWMKTMVLKTWIFLKSKSCACYLHSEFCHKSVIYP